MIVRELDGEQLLCINQTTHALLAAAFCRHWGNRDFAEPAPSVPVLMAIAQHDNGWHEWDQAPRLRADGVPMDFLHGPDGAEKLALWQRGIDRVSAQHPYAGLLVGQHAAHMHAEALANLPTDERRMTQAFIDAQAARVQALRTAWQKDAPCGLALRSPAFAAHTHLLQFGDTASLQISMPWEATRRFPNCPVDQTGTVADITMEHHGRQVTFDPWPFDVNVFEVAIHGKRLPVRHFTDACAYRQALAVAPYHRLVWTVAR